ncbi:LysR family transcriptional regulator, partial [Salmonella enterica subsp. enterica serovar Kentucky]|nr:LysR family transcriptional regulator [Salmonella enterica subsp. enterica serovar Kentucky]
AAARRLRKSQSTISTAIAHLEADLGFSLFDRSSRQPVLTEEGSVPFRRSYKLPPNYRCQSLCTAGTRMSDFWHCLIPGWIVFRV